MVATPAVTLQRVPNDLALSARDVLREVAEESWPFALTGRWAGGGAIIGSRPLVIGDDNAETIRRV